MELRRGDITEMKLAYFSPLPPQRSGISDYSEALIPELSNHYEVDLWVDGIQTDSSALKNYNIINYHNNNILDRLPSYDAILYNLGNNPEYHSNIYDIFLKYPGIIILHDYVLYYLITGYCLDYRHSKSEYIREFYHNYGSSGINKVKRLLRAKKNPLQFENPEQYPLLKRVMENAVGIIVHSDSTRSMIIENGYPENRIENINQINYNNMILSYPEGEKQELREKYGITNQDILVSSFGYIAPTKRNQQIAEVIKEIQTTKNAVKYLMVGEGNYIDGLLDENTKKTGFVAMRDFEILLSCSDIVVNLRDPSMGETSATLLRAMMAGKPCVVTDIAWFSELPDEVVIKIPNNRGQEKENLKKELELLINDSAKRKRIGDNAKNYVLMYHDPSKIAKDMKQFMDKCLSSRGALISELCIKSNESRLEDIGLTDRDDLLSKNYATRSYNRLKQICLDIETKSYKK